MIIRKNEARNNGPIRLSTVSPGAMINPCIDVYKRQDNKSEHLYHIHGTADQIFPYDRLENVFPVEGGDHLMVVKKADTVSSILDIILLKKED